MVIHECLTMPCTTKLVEKNSGKYTILFQVLYTSIHLPKVQDMGTFFLDYAPHSLDEWARPPRLACMAGRRFKMVYIDGANDSKAYGSINHFESTQ